MRVVETQQKTLGTPPVGDIVIDHRSRDDISQLLRGLQHLYTQDKLRTAIFDLLEKHIQPEVSKTVGRMGMTLWSIFVMGMLRLNLNWDYDRLQDQVNHHRLIRQMLGHSDIFDTQHYPLQTIKDNVKLLTPALLDEINQVVVSGSHDVIVKKKRKRHAEGALRFVCC
jgi:hypothetical protein